MLMHVTLLVFIMSNFKTLKRLSLAAILKYYLLAFAVHNASDLLVSQPIKNLLVYYHLLLKLY